MGLAISVEFQQNFYRLLEEDRELKLLVGEVHQTVKQATKYPYILQRVTSAKLIQSNKPSLYEISGEINVYLRDKTFSHFRIIISRIEKIFYKHQEHLASYIFISGKINDAEFGYSQDMITTKINLGYMALIQDKMGEI